MQFVKHQKNLKREIEIIAMIDHPNIIKSYRIFEDEQYLHIVTEICTGGELYDKIHTNGYLNERNARKYLWKILYAVNYLHKIGICHRDLKPENFLFDTSSDD